MTLLILTFVSLGSHSLAKAVPEYPSEKVKELLKKIRTEKNLCLQKNVWKPGVCRNQKLLLAMEGLLESYLQVQTRANSSVTKKKAAEEKYDYILKQDTLFRDAVKALKNKAHYSSSKSCFKPSLLKQLMIDQGVTENGNSVYSKHPVPGGEGVCWSNSKKKKETTVNICNYPLAIYVETHGGLDAVPTKRQREYLFSLNGCDLLSIHFSDVDSQGQERETYISYDQCMVQWNKRTADAAMTTSEVAAMEDTIGFCFREHLLPPRNIKTGRVNPLLRKPAGFETPTGPKP